MSNLDIPMHEFPLQTRSDYHIICIQRKERRVINTVMTWLTEEEEQQIDKLQGSHICLERGKRMFTVTLPQIYCYGEVDFTGETDGGENLDTIENFNFLNHFDFSGLRIPSRYNYKTHSCKSPKPYLLWTETWSPSIAAQFAHGILNKPKRIILFKSE